MSNIISFVMCLAYGSRIFGRMLVSTWPTRWWVSANWLGSLMNITSMDGECIFGYGWFWGGFSLLVWKCVSRVLRLDLLIGTRYSSWHLFALRFKGKIAKHQISGLLLWLLCCDDVILIWWAELFSRALGYVTLKCEIEGAIRAYRRCVAWCDMV